MEECVRMQQQQLRAAPTLRKKAKSVYSQRSLGTIKKRKTEKKEEKDVSSGETIMRILRMRFVVGAHSHLRLLTPSFEDLAHKNSSLNNYKSSSRCRLSKSCGHSRNPSEVAAYAAHAEKSRLCLLSRKCRNNHIPYLPCRFLLVLYLLSTLR